MTAALAAASSGDTVRLPDRCNITSNPTVPAGVFLLGSGNKSIITGTVTNNGHIERVDIVGNLVNNATIDLVGVTCSSGNGIEQTATTASSIRSGVNGQTGCTNQWYVTGGRVLFSTAGGDAKGKGIYANGATVQIFHSRFLGEIGGQIETIDLASHCDFLGVTNTDGLYHTTGTGRIAHATARTDGGTGVDVNLADVGLTFQDVSFSSITGEANISYDRGDRSNYSVEDYHAADIEAAALTRHLPAPGTSGNIAQDNGTNWVSVPLASAGGAPVDAEYVTTADDSDLTQEVTIPGLAGSADKKGSGGAAFSEEYDTGTTGLSWSPSAPNTVDSDTTILSHLYIENIDGTERFGTRSYGPTGEFDVRCKLSLGTNQIATDVAIGLHVQDSGNSNRLEVRLKSDLTNRRYIVQAYSYAAASYTQRGGDWLYQENEVYFRIARSGSSDISFYFSRNGIIWQLIATLSFSITVTACGFRIDNDGAVTSEAAIDWLRAASDFSPLDVAGLEGWYDFSDISTLFTDSGLTTPVTSDADAIGGVADKSGNGNNATQGTAGNKPTFKTGIMNGNSLARFDGGDYLDADGIATSLTGTDQPVTIIVVAKQDNYSAQYRLWGAGRDSTPTPLYDFESRTDPTYRMARRDDASTLKSGDRADPVPDSVPHIFTVVLTGTLGKLFRDGTQMGANVDLDVGALTLDNFVIGSLNAGGSYQAPWDGDICEVLVYSVELNTADRTSIESYLADKWYRTVPFGDPTYDSEVFTKAGIAHPSIKKVGSTYYMSYNMSDGIYFATSSDGETWSDQGKQISLGGVGTWYESFLGGGDLHYDSGASTWYIYAIGLNTSSEYQIGAFKNTGDPINDAWSEVTGNPLITNTATGGSDVVDPQLMYFSGGFDPGNGDGSHDYWMIVGEGTDNVQELYLFYADDIEGAWTIANSNNPIMTTISPQDLWPGDLIKVGDYIWYLYSFHDETNGKTYMRWAYSDDLITWESYGEFAIKPSQVTSGAYVWTIEGDFIIVGSELWCYVAINDADSGSKEAFSLFKMTVDDAGNTTEL